MSRGSATLAWAAAITQSSAGPPRSSTMQADTAAVEQVDRAVVRWHAELKRRYLTGDSALVATVSGLVDELLQRRAELCERRAVAARQRALCHAIYALLDYGNRLLEQDVIVRKRLEPVNVYDELGLIEIYRLLLDNDNHSLAPPTLSLLPEYISNVDESYRHIFTSLTRSHFPPLNGCSYEIQISLFSEKHDQWEPFSWRVDWTGIKWNWINSSAVFLNMPYPSGDCFLCIRVMKILTEASADTIGATKSIRRPYGFALFPLLQLDVFETTVPLILFSCADADWHQIRDLMIKRVTSKLFPVVEADIVLAVSQCRGIRKDVDMDAASFGIYQSLPMFRTNTDRNEALITVLNGEFSEKNVSRKTGTKNVLLTLQLVDGSGRLVQNAFLEDCSGCKVTESCCSLLAAANLVQWKETVLVSLPVGMTAADLALIHLRIICSFSNGRRESDGKKLPAVFGFSFLPLFDSDGLTRKDGNYRLSVFKCENVTRLRDPSRYRQLPWRRLEDNEANVMSQISVPGFPTALRHSIRLAFRLRACQLTQDERILPFVHHGARDRFQDICLSSLSSIDANTAFSTLIPLLDALMLQLSSPVTEQGAFRALQRIFSLASCVEHRSQLEQYLNLDWNCADLFGRIMEMTIESVNRCGGGPAMCGVDSVSTTGQLQAIFWSVCFAVKTLKTSPMKIEDIRSVFERLFDNIASLITSASRRIADRLAAISSLHLLMQACWPALDVTGQLRCIEVLMNKISFAFGDIVFDDCRLGFLVKILGMERIFEHEDSGRLLQSILLVILSHLRARTRLSMTLECLSALCQMLTIRNEERLILPVVMQLIEPLVGCILSVDRDNVLLAYLFVCLYHMFKLMTCACYEALFRQLRDSDGKKRLKDLLLRVFLVFRDLIKSSESAESSNKMLFPARWMRFRLLLNTVIMVAMQELSEALCSDFLPVASFDIQLWHTYIELCAAFITQPILQQVEKLSFSKELLERYGDMRVLMCFQLASLWGHLEERQCHFLPTMVGSFVDISLIPHQELRYIAIPMIVSFLIGEDLRAGTVGMVEGELFDKLDTCFAEGMGDEDYKASLIECLSVRVKSAKVSETERQRLGELTQKLNCLMELLLEYQTVTKIKCVHRTAFCLLSLINFYRYEVVRDENCHRFVDHLRIMLNTEGYTAEVAACMKLQADSLTWSGNALAATGKYPAQSEWARKEHLYQAVIAQYNLAQMWERSINLCDELAVFYRGGIFDYKKLSASLRQSADLFDGILTSGHRETHAYFRVVFCGPAFSATMRDKVFVFRGRSFDTLASFSERINSEWPDVSVVIRHKETASDVTSVDNADKSVVRVCRLRPVPDDKRPEASGSDVPELIKAYYLNNDVSTFELVRPFRRGSHDSVYSERCSDFQNLWTERTTIKTRAALPAIVPWSEVVSEKTELVSPVQTACECVRDKNAELRRAMDACVRQMIDQDQTSVFSQHLLMILKGTIEAAVNGGITVYQNAFFTPDYYTKFTTETAHLNELRRLIWDQLFLLDRGLQLSGKLVHNDCRPLQDHLVKVFGRLWKDVRRELDSPQIRRVLLGDQNRHSLPPTPPDRHSSYNNETGVQSVPFMIRSYESALGAHFDFSESELSCSGGGRSEHDEDMSSWPSRSGRDSTARKRSSGPRPFSVHFESSLESIADEPDDGDLQLSDSNSDFPRINKIWKGGRIRRFMSRLTMNEGRSPAHVVAASQRQRPSPRLSFDLNLRRIMNRNRERRKLSLGSFVPPHRHLSFPGLDTSSAQISIATDALNNLRLTESSSFAPPVSSELRNIYIPLSSRSSNRSYC